MYERTRYEQYDQKNAGFPVGGGAVCFRTAYKPFKRTHREQIQLISSLDWLRFDQLMGFSEEIREILSGVGEYADPARIQAISTAFEERLKHLEELALTHRTVADNPADDVEVDVAADYTRNMNL